MSTPKQPNRPNEPVEAVSGPDGDSRGDQDIDTAGTEADTEATGAGPSSRRQGRTDAPDASYAEAPDNEQRAVGAHDPGSMHRREDDDEAMARSSDFHDRSPGRPVIDRHR